MSFLDLARARTVLADAGFDALLATTPDDVQHLSGYRTYHAGLTGGACLLTADGGRALVVGGWDEGRARHESDVAQVRAAPTWIEVDELDALVGGRTAIRPKPVQLDLDATAVHVRDAALALGLPAAARIGVAAHALSGEAAAALARLLPQASFADAVGVFHDLRAIKHPAELERLRRAAQLADHGLAAVLDAGVLGRSPAQLRGIFTAAVWAQVRDLPDAGEVTAVRGDFTAGGEVAPSWNVDRTPIERGATLFADYGVEVEGYGSDAGRSFAVGSAASWSTRIMAALAAAHAATVPLLRPGTPMSELFEVAQGTVRAGGLPTYTRGHVGHAAGLGLDEQGPFLAPHEPRPLEPGMVVCFETPYYVRGLGGHQLEDMYAISDDGAERLTHAPGPFALV